jgi:uncharacterized membrane protein
MHSWLVLALVSGIVLGFFDIFRKMATQKVSLINVLAFYSMFSFLLLAYDYKNALNMDFSIFPMIFLKAVIIYFCWILGFLAFKHLPISIVSPLKTLTPLFTIIFGITLLGESLSLLQGIGFIIIIAAYYMLGKNGKNEIKGFLKNKYLYLMVLSAFLSSLSGLIDKIALKTINSGQMQFWFMFLLMIFYTTTFFVTSYREHKRIVIGFDYTILLTSLAIVLSDRLYFIAVAMPTSQISVIMPIRFISVFISVILGGIIFKEQNLGGKMLGICNMLIGVLLIFLG